MNVVTLLVEYDVHISVSLNTGHSLFIDCGGEGQKNFEGNTYEEDRQSSGEAIFTSSSEKWGFSSSGRFTSASDRSFVVSNRTALQGTYPKFYESARLSPLSLRYYGLCMIKGSYKVQLHFAEIMISNGPTYASLGRRIFNVSIQVST